jgi:hypothetical protein
MREKKKERTTWTRLKTWMKKRYTTTCSSTESKTQEKSNNDLFWEAEADILTEEIRGRYKRGNN